jgi:transposase
MVDMGAPIPTKLREAIVHAYHQQGCSYADISALLGVGEATVSRVLRLHRERGSIDPLPRGGGNVSPIQGAVARLLRTILEEMPDATVAELTEALVRRADLETSRSAVQRALSRMGFSKKRGPSSRRNGIPRSIDGGAGRSVRS